MPYKLIKGEFHIHYQDNPKSGPEPDGDTLKFKPDNHQLVEALPRGGRPPRITATTGMATLRFEAIDALETHFSVGDSSYNQNEQLALTARDKLLEKTGFRNIRYFDEETVKYKIKSVDNHPVRGYILSNGLDVYGRVISFVFTGDSEFQDGTEIIVQPEMLDASLNQFMLQEGHAYGAFYLSMPAELREHLEGVVQSARRDGRGLWEKAVATPGSTATVNGLDDLQKLVIWPKLFRRLAAYFDEGYQHLDDFDTWMRADPRDRDDRLILLNRELGNLHDLFNVSGNKVHLIHYSDEVVVVPDDYILPPVPVPQPPAAHIGTGDVKIIAALVNFPGSKEAGKETVTLLNTTADTADLTGWKIADAVSQQPLDGAIAAGEAHRVHLSAKVRLNNDGDTITLLDSTGRIIDQVSYKSSEVPDEGITLVF